jgi:hypothetical protein
MSGTSRKRLAQMTFALQAREQAAALRKVTDLRIEVDPREAQSADLAR